MGEVAPNLPSVLRFGVFALDLRAGELRKNGIKIKLQEQPFQVLAMLLQRPGEVVARESCPGSQIPSRLRLHIFSQGGISSEKYY